VAFKVAWRASVSERHSRRSDWSERQGGVATAFHRRPYGSRGRLLQQNRHRAADRQGEPPKRNLGDDQTRLWRFPNRDSTTAVWRPRPAGRDQALPHGREVARAPEPRLGAGLGTFVIRSLAQSSNCPFFPSSNSFVRSDVTAPSTRARCSPAPRIRRQGWSHRDQPKGLTLMASSTVPRSDEVWALRELTTSPFGVWAAPSPCGLGSRSIARAEGAARPSPAMRVSGLTADDRCRGSLRLAVAHHWGAVQAGARQRTEVAQLGPHPTGHAISIFGHLRRAHIAGSPSCLCLACASLHRCRCGATAPTRRR